MNFAISYGTFIGDDSANTGDEIINDNCVKRIDLEPAEKLENYKDSYRGYDTKYKINQMVVFLNC